MLWALAFGLVGCAPVAPSSDLLASAAPRVATAPEGPQGSFDFEGEDRPEEEEPPGEEDPIRLQARLLGVSAASLSAPAPVAPADLAPPAAAPEPAAAPPAMVGNFGVRVISTLTEVQPPRAVLGLPSGKEVVVQPGTMLPDDHIVVLAIGRTGVQIATITPEGFASRVETTTIPALYPVNPATAAP